jgi:hypothetical protein
MKKVAMPGEGIFCYFVGVIAFAAGALMLFDGFRQVPTAVGQITGGFALVISSALWFAIGRMLKFLAQIDENTRK